MAQASPTSSRSPTASATTRTSLTSSAPASSATATAAPSSASTSTHPSIPPSLAAQLAQLAKEDDSDTTTSWIPVNDEERTTLAALLLQEQEDSQRYFAGNGQRWEERRRAPTQLDDQQQQQQQQRRGLRERRSLSLPAPTLEKRQSAEGYPDCSNEGNGILSCFPFSNSTLVDNVWSKFIWNARYPTFIGAGSVDIYLYHADSETVATSFLSIDNSRGMIGIRPDDGWWPSPQTNWEQGTNQTWPYFFVIVDGGQSLTGGEEHQSTFVAVQTAAPSSLSSSILSASSASSASAASRSSASLSSVASLSSISSLSSASASSSSAARNNPNSLQDGSPSSSGSRLPHWAIAVIVVLGFLALVAIAVGAYVCMVCGRRRRERREGDEASSGKGSEQPMMSNVHHGGGGGGGAGAVEATMLGGAGVTGGARGRDSDAASRGPTSEGGNSSSDAGPITHTDAAIMAEAFRKALRKPEFPSGKTTPSPGALGSATGAEHAEHEGEVGEMGEVGEEGDDMYRARHRESRILGDGGDGGTIWENEIRSEGRSLRSVQGGRRWGQQG